MDIVYTVRRSFPGPGGIATAMRVTATELGREHHVRVFAARIDDAPVTRLNASLAPQRFHPFWSEHVEVRPIPMPAGALARAAPLALMTVPGVRRFGYQLVRRMTAPAFARAVGTALADEIEHADVVHCWGGEHTNWAAAEAARRIGARLVVTPFAHPGAWGDDALNVGFYRRADAVLALLPSEGEFYRSLGIERVRVVGVPVTPLPSTGSDIRSTHGIGDAPLVLFLGVKEPYKGYRLLLEAAPMVWGRHPEARFAFVGPPTSASRVDFDGVDDERVIEVGRVDDATVAAWHRAATVFCLPSTSEIMPVSILEAWQAGAPVVAARWWCAADLITDGRDGRIVDADAGEIARALIGLVDDPAAARAMGEAGRARVLGEFSPHAVGARHVDVYRRITA
jgi:glycosyltransferase involved in cell wall biosynthesis